MYSLNICYSVSVSLKATPYIIIEPHVVVTWGNTLTYCIFAALNTISCLAFITPPFIYIYICIGFGGRGLLVWEGGVYCHATLGVVSSWARFFLFVFFNNSSATNSYEYARTYFYSNERNLFMELEINFIIQIKQNKFIKLVLHMNA